MKLVKKLMWTSLIMVFLVSMTMVSLTWAAPATCFYVVPSTIPETPLGWFAVEITVVGAPDTYAWALSVSWNPDRLELSYVAPTEEFLDPVGAISYMHDPLPEANPIGKIDITCSLVGDPTVIPWASGDGKLATLYFIAQSGGSDIIHLSDTLLYDHMEAGYPAPTEYLNKDCTVTATNFYSAGLDMWKLKVNGKAGVSTGGGIKTTVGTPNLLEAFVTNFGTFDTTVNVIFEVLGPLGDVVAFVESNGLMLAGTSETVSAEWTAPDTKVYRITACVLYEAIIYTLDGGASKMLRLAATA